MRRLPMKLSPAPLGFSMPLRQLVSQRVKVVAAAQSTAKCARRDAARVTGLKREVEEGSTPPVLLIVGTAAV